MISCVYISCQRGERLLRKLISVPWFDNVCFEQEPGPNFESQGLSDFREGLKNVQPVEEARASSQVTKSPSGAGGQM